MGFLRPVLIASLLLIHPISGAALEWQQHDHEAFRQAAQQERLILLDLIAVWCHWCHVMEATTYQDGTVLEQIEKHYIPVQADHDARPDLAERYREYGWPATIILNADGQELLARSGYIDAKEMRDLLASTYNRRSEVAPPATASANYSTGAQISEPLLARLQENHLDTFDRRMGGLKLVQKFLDTDTVEWDLHLASSGDDTARVRARQFLDAAIQLIDPEFGGAYQYSTHGDWQHPHYEKIAVTQLKFLRAYSLGYMQFNDPTYLHAAQRVSDWLQDFLLAPNGGFYNSQDADLEPGQKAHAYFALSRDERLKLGVPRIDMNQYADTNGRLIEGLLSLYRASGDQQHLSLATSALQWVLKHRRDDNNGFLHGADDRRVAYLSDNLFMARALLAVYETTGQSQWLEAAGRVAETIIHRFRQDGGGLLSAIDNGTPVKPVAQLDQNIQAARFFIALAGHTGNQLHRQLADHVLRYLVSGEIATSRLTDAGILLADQQARLLRQGKAVDELLGPGVTL